MSLLDDEEVREMIDLLNAHFINIQKVVSAGLKAINIKEDTCQVEPSFYSVKYGIQGRLDLFAKERQSASIIELKSGSPYKSNKYGLSNNHYHQTLLYNMLIESVYGTHIKRNNFILYSKESKNPLRFAPSIRAEQREAIKERNRLYLHDRALLEPGNFIDYYKSYLSKERENIKGFLKTDYKKIF